MKIPINEKILTISGKATLPELLESGEDYILGVTVHCCQVAKDDAPNDGSFNMICRTKLLGQIHIESKLGKKMYAKVKGSPSQKMRWGIDKETGGEYEQTMALFLRFLPELIEYVKKLKEERG